MLIYSDTQEAEEYVANQLENGKRPLSSMVPVIFHTPDDRCGARGASGGEGGARILSSTIQVLWRLMLRGQSLEEAVEAPRFYVSRPQANVMVDFQLEPSLYDILNKTKGQNLVYDSDVRMSSLNVIIKMNDTVIGEADSRRDAVGLVYKRRR